MFSRSFSLLIGSRFSQKKNKSGLVSFFSNSSVVGIAVGTAFTVIGLSAINGFEIELKERVLGVFPHGEIREVGTEMSNWQSLAKDLRKNHSILAVAPFVEFSAVLEKQGTLAAVGVRGVVPELQTGVSNIHNYMNNGDLSNISKSSRSIILGNSIANKLGIQVGDYLTAMIPVKSPQYGKLAAPRRIRLRLAGTLKLGGAMDHHLAIISMKDAQEYMELGSLVSGLQVRVKDVFSARATIEKGLINLPKSKVLSSQSWERQYGYMYSNILMVRTVMCMVMGLVMMVASFNIVMTLMMVVKQRSSDIAILKTIGATNHIIRMIFAWYGLLVGAAGALIGTVIGVVLSCCLTKLAILLETLLGIKLLSGDIYFIDFLPSKCDPSDIVLVVVTALIFSLAASFYPASKACALSPSRVLSSR
ncbi:lipoprotein-releasing ABC transporter permease subunit LolE [Photobacterium kishitanii]|uniref:Lipoprotein-releasing ABC transporter permease subunit LolE n=1 Tax=Photobacterium kishitanii TaxID=318456 RepID=A0A2T3KLD1_9GAMM|nr:lipoprotein-releasing ABC transporter permease subunit LolE [Photobacterium kishitanii]PSV00460.1 lipoprotein-releasing ABC transporter permease subunit LolE [Photobacterium kishitanii]